MIPYTVLVTYYYYEGKMHIYLNSIHPIKVEQYDAKGTAKFVGEELMESLRLSKKEVKEKFVDAVYDGVYASKEERSAGGGCLSLMKNFAQWCGADESQFTGNWDMGHQLQLVFGNIMKENDQAGFMYFEKF